MMLVHRIIPAIFVGLAASTAAFSGTALRMAPVATGRVTGSSSSLTMSWHSEIRGKIRLGASTAADGRFAQENREPVRPVQWIKSKTSDLLGSLRVNEVTRWRLAAVMFLSSLVAFQPTIDTGLSKFWSFLLTSSSFPAMWFRHDHWEWVLSVSCFFVYIHAFWLCDRAVLRAARKGKDHPLRKHRLHDRYVAQQHHQELQKRKTAAIASGDAAEVDMNEPPPFVTEQSKWNFGGYIGELWVYIIPLYIWDKLDPRRARGLANWVGVPPTVAQICRDVSLGLVLYDFFFFIGHFLMHKIPFLYRRVHAKHHENPEVRSGDIVRLSIGEEVMEVGFSIIALRLLKCHPLSRSIYNIIITFFLTELHCGFDFPWTPQNVVPFGLATGSRRHHFHHRYGRHYYQKFFFSVDRLFGFFQKDDGTIPGDSIKPLHSIKDKLSWPKDAVKPQTK